MMFNGIRYKDPLKIVMSVKNTNAANSFVRGEVVQFVTGSSANGNDAILLADNTTGCVAGVADEIIAAGKSGLVQISGVHDAVLTATTATVKGAVSATVSASIGKVADHTASTAAAADLAAGIMGVVLKVTDTNSAMVYLRLM